MLLPPITEDGELNAFLYDLYVAAGDSAVGSTPANPLSGNPLAYTHQYLHVKYASDNVGTGFSDSPTGLGYFGLSNSAVSTESANATDYTWYSVSGGFGGTKFLYVWVLGGRQAKFLVDTSPPAVKWKVDPGVAIDIDLIVPSGTILFSDTTTSFVGDLSGIATSLTAGGVTTNANLTGGVTSIGNVATVVTNANLTGPITSAGNATTVASQTGTGSTFVMSTAPTVSAITVTSGFGCNGTTPQAAVTVNAAATDLPTVIALTNQLRAALIANGVCV